ncbi:MAG: toprim domain-containing protein [Candidatus Paceibacterota bacterium]
MNEFEKLVEEFRAFPGVGRRQAERFAHFITRQKTDSVESLAELLVSTRKAAHFCAACGRLVFKTTDENLCSICSSPNRDFSLLMIVEKDADLNHIERSGVYNGLYFVLGGVLPMRSDTVESSIRIPELEKRLKSNSESFSEVILALSLTPEGEFTSDFLSKKINDTQKQENTTKVTLLGRGLSVGSELEYSDRETLRQALRSRRSNAH